jgi:hypothetical protein
MTAGPPPLPYAPHDPNANAPQRVSITLLIVATLQMLLGPVATRLVSAPGAVPMQIYGLLWLGVIGLFALAALARRRPLPAASAALGLFITIHAVDALFGRVQITNGIVFKIVIVIILLRAIRTAIRATAAGK